MDGAWKFKHLKLTSHFWTPFDEGWVKSPVRIGRPAMGQMDGMVAIVTGASRGLGPGHSDGVCPGGGQRRHLRPQPVPHRPRRYPRGDGRGHQERRGRRPRRRLRRNQTNPRSTDMVRQCGGTLRQDRRAVQQRGASWCWGSRSWKSTRPAGSRSCGSTRPAPTTAAVRCLPT